MSFLKTVRLAVEEGRRELPKFFCRTALPGFPGSEVMFLAGGSARLLSASHLVALTPDGLRALAADSQGLAQAGGAMPPGETRLVRAALWHVRRRLEQGEIRPCIPAPHHFCGPRSASEWDLGRNYRFRAKERAPLEAVDEQRRLSSLLLRAEAAWCRNVAPHVDPRAMGLLADDIPYLWPALERQIRARLAGKALLGEEELSMEVPGLRFPAHLPMPWMLGFASAYSAISAGGEEGARNWKQAVRRSPAVAMQALLDAPLRERIVAGREFAGLVQRRLGLKGVASPERVMAIVSRPAPEEDAETGQPVRRTCGHMNARRLSLLLRLNPRSDFRIEETPDAARRHRMLCGFLEATWATGPMFSGFGLIGFPCGSLIPAWRIPRPEGVDRRSG